MANARVFVAADDARLRETLAAALGSAPAQFHVLARNAAPNSLIEFDSFSPHLIVLASRPGLEAGFRDAMRALRQRSAGCEAGVLAVIDTPHPSKLEPFLLAGADGAFRLSELTPDLLNERVRIVLDRVRERWGTQLTCGPIVLSLRDRSVEVGGRRTRLSKGRFDVLRRLMTRRGTTLTFSEVMGRDGSGPHDQVPSAAKSQVYHVRRALGPESRRLQSVRGEGYRLDDGDGPVA